jgi:hypothetical protein
MNLHESHPEREMTDAEFINYNIKQRILGTGALTEPTGPNWLSREVITPSVSGRRVNWQETASTLIDAIRGTMEAENGKIHNIVVSTHPALEQGDFKTFVKVFYVVPKSEQMAQPERRLSDRRGGEGQQGGQHYAAKIDPWELQRVMPSSGSAFVDARRADAIKYAWRLKGDKQKLLEDLKKARHCLDAAITELETILKANNS